MAIETGSVHYTPEVVEIGAGLAYIRLKPDVANRPPAHMWRDEPRPVHEVKALTVTLSLHGGITFDWATDDPGRPA